MGDNSNKKRSQKVNPLELLRDSGRGLGGLVSDELVRPMTKDFAEQIFGRYEKRHYSGELRPGGSLEMSEVISGRQEENERVGKQLELERRMTEEERIFVEKRTNELRVQIQAIHEEIIKLAEVTPELSQEVEIAAFQAPIEPSTYELFFLQHILEIIKSFRKKIENAKIWLHSANRRAGKKNAWGANYKKHGAKYLLSGEHYLTRSAG